MMMHAPDYRSRSRCLPVAVSERKSQQTRTYIASVHMVVLYVSCVLSSFTRLSLLIYPLTNDDNCAEVYQYYADTGHQVM